MKNKLNIMYKNYFNLRKLLAIAICLVGITMFSGCDPEEKLSSNKQIITFGFAVPPAAGIVNEQAKTVAVAVPEGTDVTVLIPVIVVSERAMVNPASGVVQNFTNPIQYTVTAEDGSSATYTVTVTAGTVPGTEPQVLTSSITTNTTLKDLGLPIDYVYNYSYLMEVTNNAILTIEPGVTIQFTDARGGINIKSGAQITAVGTAEKRIQFVGVGNTKGSWSYIDINTNTDNQFAYCDFINGGYSNNGTVRCWVGDTQFGMTYSKISGSAGKGLVIYETARITAFNNNVIEKCDDVPVWVRGPWKQIEKLDMTSTFTDNAKQYIEVSPSQYHTQDVIISRTGVPYYFAGSCDYLNATLTINEGVTIYMGDGVRLTGNSANGTGRLQINGTPEKKVKFTRLPGTSQHWQSVYFRGLTGSVVNNCIFEYGGKDNNSGIIEIADNADVTLNNVEINNSYNYGVKIDTWGNTYRLTHTNVTFAGNYKGNVHDFRNDLILDQLP